MSEHTPGPWIVGGRYNSKILCNDGETVIADLWAIPREGGVDEGKANARRIVACVNACEGMEDPSSEIDSLRKDIAAMELNAEQDSLVVQELGADMVALQSENARLRDAALAFQDLTVCYRINKRPSDKLFKRLEAARETLESED